MTTHLFAVRDSIHAPNRRPTRRGGVLRSVLAVGLLLGVTGVAAVGGWRLAEASTRSEAEIVPIASFVVPASARFETKTHFAASAPSVVEWTDRVWQAARRGDKATLDRTLAAPPAEADERLVSRLKETVELRSRHLADAKEAIEAEREKTLAEIAKAAEKGDLSQALASAMVLQSITDEWESQLQSERIAPLVTQAEERAAEAREAGDLLLAQEMLARLRLLHEDVDEPQRVRRYRESLDEINRRIGLIAHYAPARLHELRREQMARLQPERDFPEFNPVGLDDWREQSSGISQPMLLRAMRTAATEHIANEGWKPLLLGGLESMRIFATTPDLAESFPSLNDAQRVGGWIEAIDGLVQGIERKTARDVGLGDYRRIVETIMRTNPRTIDVPQSVLLREFGDGAAGKLAQLFDDQYTEMIWPERLRRFEQQTEGNFVGVGIMIRMNDRREIVVVHPLEGSPAYRAGVQAEDRIATVDGASTFGWSLNKAVDTITGPRGRVVRLGVVRGPEGEEETLDFPIVRDTIKIRSVNGWWKTGLDADGVPEWDWMIDPVGRIGYVRLTGFSDDSFVDFLNALDEMWSDGAPNGLILDLRNNPGGLLRSAVQFSNLFVPRGTIVVGENKDGRIEWRQEAHPNRSDTRLSTLPVVILINEASASASEIVAGALQAHNAAIVVGERTFGKGSVQTVHDISDTGARAAIKLTTQHYVLPGRDGQGGRPVQRYPGAKDWGVNPDLAVRMTPTQMERAIRVRQEADHISNAGPGEADENGERRHAAELLTEGIDPQLQTALMILQARALRHRPAVEAAAMR